MACSIAISSRTSRIAKTVTGDLVSARRARVVVVTYEVGIARAPESARFRPEFVRDDEQRIRWRSLVQSDFESQTREIPGSRRSDLTLEGQVVRVNFELSVTSAPAIRPPVASANPVFARPAAVPDECVMTTLLEPLQGVVDLALGVMRSLPFVSDVSTV